MWSFNDSYDSVLIANLFIPHCDICHLSRQKKLPYYYQPWDSRLSEGFSPGRELLTWEGEILGYTEGFSLERGLARLSESWLAWARKSQLGGLRRDPKVGGGVGGTCEVTRNQTQHSPSLIKLSLYSLLLSVINISLLSSNSYTPQVLAEYRGLDKSCRWNPSPFQVGFTPNAAIEWVQGMECTNMKADGVATSESIPHKDFGPQRNFVHERGKDKMYRGERKHYFPRVGTRSCISYGPRTHANVGGSRPIKRHCPTSRQSMNAMGTGRPQSIGRVVTMYGAEASELDSLIRCGMHEERGMDVSTARSLSIIKGIVPSWIGDLMPLLPRRQETTVRWLPQVAPGHQVLMIQREVVAVRDLCEISDHASSMGPVSAKKVITLLRKMDRVDMRDDVPVGFNPGNGLAIDMGSGVPHSLKFESVIGILNRLYLKNGKGCGLIHENPKNPKSENVVKGENE
ncbi:hypothetical protein Lal_00015300 [Lupinus albus]|nr:hypothetical protein Lal_00015300 [Lupinus albus]